METINKIEDLISDHIDGARNNLRQIKKCHNSLNLIEKTHERACSIYDVIKSDIKMNSEYISRCNEMDEFAKNFKKDIAYAFSYLTEMFFIQDNEGNVFEVIKVRNRMDELIDYIREGQNYTNISYDDIIPNIIRIEIALLQKPNNPLFISLGIRITELKNIT